MSPPLYFYSFHPELGFNIFYMDLIDISLMHFAFGTAQPLLTAGFDLEAA